MECGDKIGILNNMKTEIKEESEWEEDTATHLTGETEFSSEMVPVTGIKKESVSEANMLDEDPLSLSPRSTSEEVSQDGSGTSLAHSDSGRHCHMAEVVLSADTQPYKCDRYEKSFKQKSCSQRHTSLHADSRPYKCDVCERPFKFKSDLQIHILIHADTKSFKCDKCEKSFKQKTCLLRHIRLHSESRPYKCDMCEKCFKTKSNLKDHIQVHLGTKLFKCDICEESFRWNHGLQQHLLLHSEASKGTDV